MAQKTPRNTPCPCGSGEKYKRCHGVANQSASMESDIALPTARRGIPRPFIFALSGGILAFAIGLGVTGHKDIAFISLGVGAMAILALVVFGNLPPPRGEGDDPGAINFGR